MLDRENFIQVGRKKRYQAYCDICGSDRGHQLEDHSGLCYHCGLKRRNENSLSYKIITITDFIVKNSDKYYHMHCRTCGKDRGYQHKKTVNKECLSCASRRRNKIRYEKVDKRHQKLRQIMKAAIGRALKRHDSSKLGNSINQILPYSIPELKQSLESKFQLGMTWDNYGLYGWHIDHIIPDSWFTYKSYQDIDFQKSWALENLQPMWAHDNLIKSNRYSG